MADTNVTLFGIPSCDSCTKARRWLVENSVEHTFHDIRKDGLTVQQLSMWSDSVGWQVLLNKRSLTWRKVPEADRQDLTDNKVIALILEQPTLLKRPVLSFKGKLVVGFDAAAYAAL